MDQVGSAIREERIKELELTERQLHEQLAGAAQKLQAQEDHVTALGQQMTETYWQPYVGTRDARIVELERENNGLRKQLATALAFAREKQDQYDDLCTKTGAE